MKNNFDHENHSHDPRELSSADLKQHENCEHDNPDSLDARLFPSVVLAAAPAVTVDEASSLLSSRARHMWLIITTTTSYY